LPVIYLIGILSFSLKLYYGYCFERFRKLTNSTLHPKICRCLKNIILCKFYNICVFLRACTCSLSVRFFFLKKRKEKRSKNAKHEGRFFCSLSKEISRLRNKWRLLINSGTIWRGHLAIYYKKSLTQEKTIHYLVCHGKGNDVWLYFEGIAVCW